VSCLYFFLFFSFLVSPSLCTSHIFIIQILVRDPTESPIKNQYVNFIWVIKYLLVRGGRKKLKTRFGAPTKWTQWRELVWEPVEKSAPAMSETHLTFLQNWCFACLENVLFHFRGVFTSKRRVNHLQRQLNEWKSWTSLDSYMRVSLHPSPRDNTWRSVFSIPKALNEKNVCSKVPPGFFHISNSKIIHVQN
jgi:hypothetical protein